MPAPVTIPKTLIASSVACVAQGQSLAAAGNLVLNGTSVVAGTAILDTQRKVLITSAGDDSKVNFTITGSNDFGNPINEIVAGTSAAAVASTLDFLNIGTVAADGKIASKVTIGTNGVGATPWMMPNYYENPFNAQVNTTVAGTVNYTVQYTMDSYALPANPTSLPTAITLGTITSKTTADVASLTSPIVGWRTVVNSGTGTVTTKFLQAGIVNS